MEDLRLTTTLYYRYYYSLLPLLLLFTTGVSAPCHGRVVPVTVKGDSTSDGEFTKFVW